MAEEKFAKDTSNRTKKEWLQGIFVLIVGLTIAHFGVTLFILARLGSDPFTVLVHGLSLKIGLTIGQTQIIVMSCITVILFFATKNYIKIGTVICALLGGLIIDFFSFLLSPFITVDTIMPIRILILICGCVILAFGMTFVIRSNTGTGPNDLISIIFADTMSKKRKFDFRWARTICDLVFTLIGFLLGGLVGVGTIISILLVGQIAQFFLPISNKIVTKCFPTI